MKIASVTVPDPGTEAAVGACHDQVKSELGGEPSLILALASAGFRAPELYDILRERAGETPLHCVTSCRGILTREGFLGPGNEGLVLWAIRDEAGSYGTGFAELGEDPSESAGEAVLMALQEAGRPGETPHLIWLTATSGVTGAALEGVRGIVGTGVPIVAGSPAGGPRAGEWALFSNRKAAVRAVMATVFFPSGNLSFFFQSGYGPTGTKAVATSVRGNTILELDGKPAVGVYNQWTGGLIADSLEGGGSTLGVTNLHPLGRRVGDIRGIPFFQITHPESIGGDGSISVSGIIEEGDEVTLLAGSPENLSRRSMRVIRSAMDNASMERGDLAGILLTLCAECMVGTGNQLDDVSRDLRKLLPGTPILGPLTSGERGCFRGGENRSCNLTISAAVFGP